VPLCRYHRSRPLQVRKRTFGPPVPTASRVPSSWFLTTSTVCSSYGFAGLLHPATSLRFVAFPASLPVFVETKAQASRTPSQATCFTPFRAFPSSVAVPRHHLHQKPKSLLPMFTNGRCPHDIPTSNCCFHLLAPKRALASTAADRACTRRTPRDCSPTPLPGLVHRLVSLGKAVFKALLH